MPRSFDIRIARDGTWYHEGRPIPRKRLVKLFSTVLRREDDGYWLVTPVERGRIEVEDAPFVAVELSVTGSGREQELSFRTNLDEWVRADAEHPIRVEEDPGTGEPSPYILVRDRLEALLLRPVYYELAELATAGEGGAGDAGTGDSREDVIGVWSAGSFFPLARLG